MSGLEIDSQLLTYWRDCVNAFLDAFFPGAKVQVQQRVCGAVGPLEVGEVDYAFSRVWSDGMIGAVYKSIWKAISEFVMVLYTKCLGEGYLSPRWKEATVVLPLKSADKIQIIVRSYWSICLPLVLGKVLERITVERLQERIKGRELRRQFRFRQ